MPFPIYDVVPCMKTTSERTDTVMRKIQDLLHRNVSPKKYSNGQAFRLQQVRNILLGTIFVEYVIKVECDVAKCMFSVLASSYNIAQQS